MGASREAALSAFAEPALFLCFAGLALARGDFSLSGMLAGPLGVTGPGGPAGPGGPGGPGGPDAASLLMTAASLFLVLLAETSRVPVDDPATHLELTMIHEVLVLDSSGPDLALLQYGSALKLALFAALIVGVLVPRASLPGPAALGLLVLGLVGVAVLVGVVESLMARLRLSRVPQFLVAASVLAALGLVLLLLA
jgi:formate hydrogenlyase subunit 4